MLTETATLLAVLAAPIAVLAVVAAVLVGMTAHRGRQALVRTATRLERQETVIREELATARGSLELLGSTIMELRTHGTALDADLVAWTAGLKAQRMTIERLSHGRLGPAIRAVQVASALARVVMLWRTPAR